MTQPDRAGGTVSNVAPVRVFRTTQMELTALFDWTAWFVYDRHVGERAWHKHCGPYSTREQAVDWILAIQETLP